MIDRAARSANVAPAHPPAILLLGLGNPILRDDAVGLHVVRRLRPRLACCPDVLVAEDCWGGLRLMERMVGFQRAIIVDAICSGSTPGTVRVLGPDDLPTRHSASAHDLNLTTALSLGRQAGAVLPHRADIRLVAIEAADVVSFGESCSPPVAESIGRAADEVISILRRWEHAEDRAALPADRCLEALPDASGPQARPGYDESR
jgi:hydrogenase maturation protease